MFGITFRMVRHGGCSDFLGIDTHPLTKAALHVSPFFTRSHHALTHGVYAFPLGFAQVLEQTHRWFPFLSGPSFANDYGSISWMRATPGWKLLLARVAADFWSCAIHRCSLKMLLLVFRCPDAPMIRCTDDPIFHSPRWSAAFHYGATFFVRINMCP